MNKSFFVQAFLVQTWANLNIKGQFGKESSRIHYCSLYIILNRKAYDKKKNRT